MDGYLVMLKHSSDDIPVSLHAARMHADKAAKETPWYLPERNNASTPVLITVVEFHDGKFVREYIIRHFDDEPQKHETGK